MRWYDENKYNYKETMSSFDLMDNTDCICQGYITVNNCIDKLLYYQKGWDKNVFVIKKRA